MRHCKLEYDDQDYEIVKEAAYQARTPIRVWVRQASIAAAKEVLAGQKVPVTMHEIPASFVLGQETRPPPSPEAPPAKPEEDGCSTAPKVTSP